MRHSGRLFLALICVTALAGAQEPPPPVGEDEGSRIVGGFRARAGSAPWQVEIYSTSEYSEEEIAQDRALRDDDPGKKFLYLKPKWEINHRCGGALIAPQWLLTAAHCVVKVKDDPMQTRRIRLGTQDLSLGGADYPIERIVVHKDYEVATKKHDIALIRIGEGPATPGALRPIRLLGAKPGDRALAAHDRVSVTGWGLTGVRNSGSGALARDGSVLRGSPALMQVDLQVLSRAECAKVPEYQGYLGDEVVCAGSSVPGRDSCNGDSGGPLTRAQGSERVLVGLVSWGKGCGLPGVPGIYTNVAHYSQWISDAMKSAPAGRLTRM